ncbi:MAG: hypothetical protein D6806_09605 [Deltaproteobacteria bacterium]|nr:MAG: hypothetical protein D6806_09605 [Deltaproteobacteria bacterium]
MFTDSMEMYESRLAEARRAEGEYIRNHAELDYHRHLMELDIAHVLELDHRQRRRIHNLKYFTWIEQQKKDVEELRAQWYEYKTYWPERFGRADEYDRLIEQFNELVGLDEIP